MDDVYKMLNYIYDQNFMTHQLPMAMEGLKNKNPNWYRYGVVILDEIKRISNTNNFEDLMNDIDTYYGNIEIKLEKLAED